MNQEIDNTQIRIDSNCSQFHKFQSLVTFVKCSKSKKIKNKFIDKNIFTKINHHFFKSIIKMINEYFPKLPGLSDLKIFKEIPFTLINKLRMKFKSNFLDLTIEKFFCLIYEDKIVNKVLQNLQNILIIKKEQPTDVFLSMNLKNVYSLYVESNYYQEDIEKIKKDEHEFYYKKYLELTVKFINHYSS